MNEQVKMGNPTSKKIINKIAEHEGTFWYCTNVLTADRSYFMFQVEREPLVEVIKIADAKNMLVRGALRADKLIVDIR